MKRNIVIVEVGVRKLEGQREFESYMREGLGVSLYDENVICYVEEDLERAKAYAHNYVEVGVTQTYAIVYHGGQVNLDDEQLKEIIDFGCYEYCDSPTKQDIIVTYYKGITSLI